MGKLKIHCVYQENGSKEISLLSDLDNHEKSCRFDKPICDQCFWLQSVYQNCVKSLLEIKTKLEEKNYRIAKWA